VYRLALTLPHNTPPHPALHHAPSHYPSRLSFPSQNMPALSSPGSTPPSTPFSCIPPSTLLPIPGLLAALRVEGLQSAERHCPVAASGFAPGSGSLMKQAAGLGPTPGWSVSAGNSTAAESLAERAEQCWEYQSARLGSGGCPHSQCFHRTEDSQLGCWSQPGTQPRAAEGSASLCTRASRQLVRGD